MEEMRKHGHIGRAAMKAGMDRKTARKYADGGKLPSELTTRRDWKTRVDPFVSAEPLLGSVDLTPWLDHIGLVIGGCESGENRRLADVAWFRSLRDQSLPGAWILGAAHGTCCNCE